MEKPGPKRLTAGGSTCGCCCCRRVGRRVGVHARHDLAGTLLRHLSTADVAAMADSSARRAHDRRRVDRLARRHDADRRLPATAPHADRRPQVRRGLERPLPRKGIRPRPSISVNVNVNRKFLVWLKCSPRNHTHHTTLGLGAIIGNSLQKSTNFMIVISFSACCIKTCID